MVKLVIQSYVKPIYIYAILYISFHNFKIEMMVLKLNLEVTIAFFALSTKTSN